VWGVASTANRHVLVFAADGKIGHMRKAAAWAGLLFVLAAHIAIRLRPAQAVLSSDERRPLFAGADSFHHARRTELSFEHFPSLAYYDRFMFHPEGAIAQWSLGFDYPVAALLRGFTTHWDEAVWWLPFVTLALSLCALLAFYAQVQRQCPSWAAQLLALAFALNLAFVRVSTPAEYDHHVVETLCVVLLMALPGVSARPAGAQVALGLALAWTLWTSTLLAFVMGAFFAIYLVATQLRWAPPPRRFAAFAGPFLLASLSFVTLESSARSDYFALPTLSFTHLALIALPVVALLVAERVPARWLWTVAAVLAVAFVALRPAAMAWVLSFASGGDAVLGNVNEARPLLREGDGYSVHHAHAFFGVALVLFPFAAVRRFRDGRSSGTTRVVVLFASLLVVLAFVQKRFAHLAVPGFVLLLGFSALRTARPRVTFAFVLLLLFEPAVTFYEGTALAIPDGARVAQRVANVVRAHARGDSLGVSTPPNFCSAINYFAGLPSVTNAFFYPRYLHEDLTLRQFESSAALVAHLQARRIGFVVLTDDARYRAMLYRAFLSPADAQRAELWAKRPCSGELLRFAYDRLVCDREQSPALTLLARMEVSQSPKRLFRKLALFALQTTSVSGDSGRADHVEGETRAEP
jgi:hypothetical protein